MAECIFCKIARKEVNSEIVHETDDLVAFNDLNPQAPRHVLIIPKKHIPGLSGVSGEDAALLGKLQLAAGEIAKKLNISDYRLVVNNGARAGQSVFHLHYHFLAGRRMNWPPG